MIYVFSCQHNPDCGIAINSVVYAHFYGELNKEGEIGMLNTIALSSEMKVYQLHCSGQHIEVKWQNNPTSRKNNTAYITIALIGEGRGYECSIKPVFVSELGIYI